MAFLTGATSPMLSFKLCRAVFLFEPRQFNTLYSHSFLQGTLHLMHVSGTWKRKHGPSLKLKFMGFENPIPVYILC